MAERLTEGVKGDAPGVGGADEDRSERTSKLGVYLRKRRPWTQRFLGLILLSPAFALAFVFWRVPVTEPLTVSALLADRVLLVGTALVLPVCVLALVAGTWQWARRGAVAGATVAVALGFSISLAALRPPVDPRPTVLAMATWLEVSACCFGP